LKTGARSGATRRVHISGIQPIIRSAFLCWLTILEKPPRCSASNAKATRGETLTLGIFVQPLRGGFILSGS